MERRRSLDEFADERQQQEGECVLAICIADERKLAHQFFDEQLLRAVDLELGGLLRDRRHDEAGRWVVVGPRRRAVAGYHRDGAVRCDDRCCCDADQRRQRYLGRGQHVADQVLWRPYRADNLIRHLHGPAHPADVKAQPIERQRLDVRHALGRRLDPTQDRAEPEEHRRIIPLP